MAKNDFKVISIFRIIIRIYNKIFEFCGKTSNFLPKRCLFIFCIFYLNKEELIQQVCLKIYIKNEIFNSKQKKKQNTKQKSKKEIAKI